MCVWVRVWVCVCVIHIISGMKERIIYVHGTWQESFSLYGTLCDKNMYFLFFFGFKTCVIDVVLKKLFLN